MHVLEQKITNAERDLVSTKGQRTAMIAMFCVGAVSAVICITIGLFDNPKSITSSSGRSTLGMTGVGFSLFFSVFLNMSHFRISMLNNHLDVLRYLLENETGNHDNMIE